MKIQSARRVRGELKLPGDKSITHRAAIISALAEGETTIHNFSTSEDCASTLFCLQRLGVSIERNENIVRINGVGLKNGLRASASVLDCGNSGSTMRMLAGILAGQNFATMLAGDASLVKRPMRRIIAPLEAMGAQVFSEDGHAPLRIVGKHSLQAIRYETPVASAQVKSCVLLAGLYADGRTEVVEQTMTRDHTERMLRWFGVDVHDAKIPNDETIKSANNFRNRVGDYDASQCASHCVSIAPPFKLIAREFKVPCDISSATFFIAAASLLPRSHLMLRGIGLNPTRAGILEVMELLGAQIKITNAREESNEPIGDIEIIGGFDAVRTNENISAKANVLSGATVAGLIDELPMLAVVGTQLADGLEIRDASELRVKESDRISATVENLRAMGAEVEEHADGMCVKGNAKLRGARIESYGDHRIAMAFSIAALLAEGESEIVGAECVGISFPEFFELLASIVER